MTNKPPFISCICLTYGRLELLQEALKCFLSQKYEGKKELIIYNTLAEQELVFDHPEVVVINSKVRPKTIGETRNAAIEASHGELIIHWDDDDKWLENHLSNSVRGYRSGSHHWSWQSSQFFLEGHEIRGVKPGSPNVFSYSRKAWGSVGGFNSQNIGEDQSFIGKVTKQFVGIKIPIAREEISFLYHWGQGAYHISGQGGEGEKTAMERSAAHVKEKLMSSNMPTGRIVLEPKFEHDYTAIVKNFLYGINHMSAKRNGLFSLIALGRFGDIINILPVAKYISDKWAKPLFFVSEEFASVLDGVSYVVPRPVALKYDQVNEAIQIAKKEASINLVAQVWGKSFGVEKTTSAFNMESWKMCGFLNEFNNVKDFPLVIDRRSREREDKLIAPFPIGRPIALLSLNCGHSSPFANGRKLAEMLTARWNERCLVIDLCDVKAERIYDVLALYDKAAVLVTSDTAHLHLAAASKVPVISLANDSDWSGSESRCNKVLRLRYSEAFDNLAGINKVIAEMVK